MGVVGAARLSHVVNGVHRMHCCMRTKGFPTGSWSTTRRPINPFHAKALRDLFIGIHVLPLLSTSTRHMRVNEDIDEFHALCFRRS